MFIALHVPIVVADSVKVQVSPMNTTAFTEEPRLSVAILVMVQVFALKLNWRLSRDLFQVAYSLIELSVDGVIAAPIRKL